MRARPHPSAPPPDLAARILYIDAHCLVLDKPAGLAVHPGPRTPHSLEDWLPALRQGFQRLPGIAHRLDRDTSGALALGRHPRALKRLMALFAAGAVSKTYWAQLDSLPDADEGLIDAPLRKISSAADGWRMVVDAAGKPAQTRWQLLDRAARLVAFFPATGRTHQLRAHAAALGHPISGDPVYGAGQGPLRLHARRIVIPYAEGAPPLDVTAPLPPGWPAVAV